jgi:hypothetical protein
MHFQSVEWIATAGTLVFLGWVTRIGLPDRLKNHFGMDVREWQHFTSPFIFRKQKTIVVNH